MDYTLNCNGRLLSLAEPQVMGILNATPDSFYAASRQQTEHDIAERTRQIVSEGGSIIDVGACSTRPGSEAVSEAEEMARLRTALAIVRREAPEAVVSVDTFRPDVARMVVEEFGADIINDVGGSVDTGYNSVAAHGTETEDGIGTGKDSLKRMFRTVSSLGVPYIYMSWKRNMRDILIDCAEATDMLRSMGQKDIILDPGFGFGKTVEENYAVMNGLERMQMTRLPVLVGISRKSMINRLLGIQPEQALNGTTVLNTLALLKGASILRVHDVREAVECVRVVAAATQSQHTVNDKQ